MVDFRAGAGKIQNEPGASSSAQSKEVFKKEWWLIEMAQEPV